MKHLKNKTQRGAALVEFSVIAMIFFLFIFAIFEIGLMISIKIGLDAGQFYSSRQAIASDLTTDEIKNIFIQYFNKFTYALSTSFTLGITYYPDLQSLYTNTSPSSPTTNITNGVYLYQSTYPYIYITRFISGSNTAKNITFSKAVWNEIF
jgi:Flp pilus assembly protein TadG